MKTLILLTLLAILPSCTAVDPLEKAIEARCLQMMGKPATQPQPQP